MELVLPQLRPTRKNTQVRLCEEAIAAIDKLIDHYGNGHSKSDIVEAAILAAEREIDGKEKGKKK